MTACPNQAASPPVVHIRLVASKACGRETASARCPRDASPMKMPTKTRIDFLIPKPRCKESCNATQMSSKFFPGGGEITAKHLQLRQLLIEMKAKVAL